MNFLPVAKFRERWLLLVVAVTGAPWLLYAMPFQPAPVQFASLQELLHFAKRNGLYVYRDGRSPFVDRQGWIADRRLSESDIRGLDEFQCTERASCRGIIWLTEQGAPPNQPTIYPQSLGNRHRFWGKLLVTGDEGLMDRIEDLHKRKDVRRAE